MFVMESNRTNANPEIESRLNRRIDEIESSELSPEATNNWSRFSEWIHCMCVVTFDLELGQAIEVIYPLKFAPSEQEKINICYLAFPDSNSGCMGDTQFHVRLRLAPDCNYTDNRNSLLSVEHKRFNSQCTSVQKADKSHYWGFVYFRQRREANLPRGYFQKSFILITKLPFFNLFNEILSQLAPKYFQDGFSVIESACRQICAWPSLRTGESLNLALFGTVYQTVILHANSKGGSSNGSSKSYSSSISLRGTDSVNRNLDNESMSDPYSITETKVIASVSEIDIFRSLSCVISNVFTLWELVLTAEPIVVVGSSPADTSHMVQSLISLIAPLEYCAESRPYFTIHDSEFKEFTREQGQSPPAIIIGVTNPFFVKLFKEWPHMIRIPVSDSLHPGSHLATTTNSSPNTTNPSLYTATNSGNFNKRIISTDNATGLITKYKPFLKKDKVLIKKILLGVNTKRPEHVQSALLRRNFLELTQSFMIPLERYMASLMPLQRDISPFKAAPSPNQFKQDDFLATLDQSGPHLTSPLKGNWKGLYQRFFNSPNFKGWYESRHSELQRTLQTIQLQALSAADLHQWAQGKQEVEIIDMIIKLKQKLNLSTNDGTNNECILLNEQVVGSTQLNETRKKLLCQIESMKQSLPDDLKTILFDS